MCRTSQALYIWCQCEESHILEPCNIGRSSPNSNSNNSSCDSTASETVYLHCFCRYHSVNGFKSVKEDRKVQRKADRKKNKRRSMDSATSVDSMDSTASTSTVSSFASGFLEKSSGRFRRSLVNLRKLNFA